MRVFQPLLGAGHFALQLSLLLAAVVFWGGCAQKKVVSRLDRVEQRLANVQSAASLAHLSCPDGWVVYRWTTKGNKGKWVVHDNQARHGLPNDEILAKPKRKGDEEGELVAKRCGHLNGKKQAKKQKAKAPEPKGHKRGDLTTLGCRTVDSSDRQCEEYCLYEQQEDGSWILIYAGCDRYPSVCEGCPPQPPEARLRRLEEK